MITISAFLPCVRVKGCMEGHAHVQYTQTDTIRQTHGPLVPMVRLVPIEKYVIPMVLLVNMHLIKGTLIIFHVTWLGTGQFRCIGTNRK